jgi:hypothetical protein
MRNRPRLAEPLAGERTYLQLIERLAELYARGILTEAEFSAKKAELLGRLYLSGQKV